jgi:cell wall-associated NlpC family hydrolase
MFEGPVSDSTLLEEASTPQERIEAIRAITDEAMLYLNAPYLWGGRSPFGIDCSGFVQMVYKLKKVKLLRDATQQATQGEIVNLLEEAEPGDLAFFDNEEGQISHVGMLIDRFRIIHASGQVRIDAIDHEGIFDGKLEKYTHKLRLIKRMV